MMQIRYSSVVARLFSALIFMGLPAYSLASGSQAGEYPIVFPVDVNNRFTNLTIRSIEDKVHVHIEYLLQEAYRNSSRINVVAFDHGTDRKVIEVTTQDDGTDGADIILRRDPEIKSSGETIRLVIRIVSDAGNVIAERVVRGPIKWKSGLADRTENAAPPEMYQVASRINKLLHQLEFEQLDDLCAQWKDAGQRTSDGRWKLEGFEFVRQYWVEEGWWERKTGIFGEWKKHNPQSECAAIMEASAWIEYARQSKGSRNPGNDDTSPARDVYKHSLEEAERILVASKHFADDNPLWYERYIYTLNRLGRDKSAIFNIFLEAIGKEQYYYPVYQATAVAMMPRWGGSYDIVGKIADAAHAIANETEGKVIYARIYWAVDSSMPEEGMLFRKTRVSWLTMKEGFLEIMRQYPEHNLNLNQFASYACQAGDGRQFLELRDRLRNKSIDRSAWDSNYSLDVCDHTFMQRL